MQKMIFIRPTQTDHPAVPPARPYRARRAPRIGEPVEPALLIPALLAHQPLDVLHGDGRETVWHTLPEFRTAARRATRAERNAAWLSQTSEPQHDAHVRAFGSSCC